MAPVKNGREVRSRKRSLGHGSTTAKNKENPENQTIRIPKSAMFDSIRLPTIQFSDSQPPVKKIRIASFDLTAPILISKHDDDIDDNVDDPIFHDATVDFDDEDDETDLEATTTTTKSATTIKDKTITTHRETKDEPKRMISALEARKAKRTEATIEPASDSNKQPPVGALAAQKRRKEKAAVTTATATATTEPASDSTQSPVSALAAQKRRKEQAAVTTEPASDSTQPPVRTSAGEKTKKVGTKPPPVSARAAREAKKALASTTIGTATAATDSTEPHAIVSAKEVEIATSVSKSANTPMVSAAAARKAKRAAEALKVPTSSSTSENQHVPTTDDSDRVPGKIFTSPPPTLPPASSTVADPDDISKNELEDEDEYATPTEELDVDETIFEDESQERVSSWKSEERKRKAQWKETNKLMDSYSVSTFSSDNANPFQYGDETYYCIGLEKGQQLVFLGYSLIGVLYGSVDIGGATISASDEVPTQQISTSESAKRKVSFFPVFSPKTSALAVIRSIAYSKSATVSPSSTLDSIYSDVKPLLEPYLPILDTLESIIIVKNMEWCGVEDLEQINPYMRNLFRFDSKTDLVRNDGLIYEDMIGFQPIINVTPEVRAMKIESSWSTTMDDVLKFEKDHSAASVSMICGTKNVGKSSFARYMINRLLNSHQRVAFLETDVGQTEFTPSGLVSLHIVETPLLGPSFTHPNMKSKRSFFIGSLSPKNDSTYYQDCIHQLLETYRQEAAIGSSNDDYDDNNKINDKDINQYQRMPLVVNTSGWIKGLGYDLLLALAEDVAPTHIFAFGDSEVRANLPNYFKEQITHAAQQTSNSQYCPVQFSIIQPATITANTQNIPPSALSLQRQRRPIAPSTMADKYQAADHRNLMLISYMYHDAQTFGTRQQGRRWWNVNPRLVSRVPWMINWQDLYGVRVLFEDVPPSKLLYALNGSMVGLIGKVKKAAVTPSAAADDDGKAGNGHMETEEAIDAQEKQESTKVKEATQSRSKSEIPIRYFSPMTSAPPNPSTTTCYGLGIIRSIDPEQRCFYLLTPLPLNQLSHVDTLVKGELDIPVHLLLDQHVGARNQNCGVPWRQVPYLSHDVIDSIGSSAPRPRRNLMRRSQRIG